MMRSPAKGHLPSTSYGAGNYQNSSYPQQSGQQNQQLPSLQQQLLQTAAYTPVVGYHAPIYHYPQQTVPETNEYMHQYGIVNNNNNNPYPYLTQDYNSRMPGTTTTTTTTDSTTTDYLALPQQNRYGEPISPLEKDVVGISYGRPMFQLASQASFHRHHHQQQPVSISQSTVTRAIEAAEASVAQEVGHITRRRRKDRNINSKSDATYVCHTCGKTFNRPYNLKSHQKTHSTDKPFPCKFCNKPFARSHDRKRHEKLHEGEKRFKCGGILKDGVTHWGCNRRFARADALGRHFRTETGWSCIRPLMMEAREQEAREGIIHGPNSDALANMEINKLLERQL